MRHDSIFRDPVITTHVRCVRRLCAFSSLHLCVCMWVTRGLKTHMPRRMKRARASVPGNNRANTHKRDVESEEAAPRPIARRSMRANARAGKTTFAHRIGNDTEQARERWKEERGWREGVEGRMEEGRGEREAERGWCEWGGTARRERQGYSRLYKLTQIEPYWRSMLPAAASKPDATPGPDVQYIRK